MRDSNKFLCGFPGFLFLEHTESHKILIICNNFNDIFSWIKSSFDACHETYVAPRELIDGARPSMETGRCTNIHFTSLNKLTSPSYNQFFNEIIILDNSLKIKVLIPLLADGGAITCLTGIEHHPMIDNHFKDTNWINNFSFNLHQDKDTFILSKDNDFHSFPFKLFQTSIISRIKTFFFRKSIFFKTFKKKNIYKLISYSPRPNRNKEVIFNAITNAAVNNIFIRNNRIAILCERSQIIKVPLSTSSLESMQKSFEHMKTISEKSIQLLGNILPKPLECNTNKFPYYEKETRCNGVIASAYTFKFFYIKKIITNSTQLLTEYHISTKRLVTIDDSAFHTSIGFYIDYLKSKAARTKPEYFDALKSLLFLRLKDKTVPLITSHGDYWLGNIIVSQADLSINGIIDWDNAKENQLPLIDLLHLLTTKDKHFTGKYFGKYILHVLLPNRLRRWKKQLITDYMEKIDIDRLFLDVLIITYWLQRCYLWYSINVEDPNNLNDREQEWINNSLHSIIDKIINDYLT